jgi:nucleoside 2-deoxyribosyltransferase
MLTPNKKAGVAAPANTRRPQATSNELLAENRETSKFSGPRIFIAGKIRPYCFRHDLVRGLRNGWDGKVALQCNGFTYVGPFMDACDHGCRHGPGSHGVLGVAGLGCEGVEATRSSVYQRNQFGIQTADLVVAYIDAPDCYGTIFELGYAAYAGIPYVVLFAPGIDISDFWYLRQSQAKFRAPYLVPRKKLPSVFADILAQLGAAQ